MYTATWHDKNSRKKFPKTPENNKKFKRLNDIKLFSMKDNMNGIKIYVNWGLKVRYWYIAINGKLSREKNNKRK